MQIHKQNVNNTDRRTNIRNQEVANSNMSHTTISKADSTLLKKERCR